MRKRVEGSTIFLEDADGSVLLTTNVDEGKAILTHGDWTMVKDLAANPQSTLAALAPYGTPRLRFRFYDVVIELYSNIPEILADFESVYSQFADHAADAAQTSLAIHALKVDGAPMYPFAMVMQPSPDARLKGDFSAVSHFYRLSDLLFQVHAEAEVFFLTNNPNHRFIHGGAVERNGIGYMLPAESKSGKTTLTLALLLAGYQFMSDEFAVLDAVNGDLLPFPRSLSLRADTLTMFPGLHSSIEQLPVLSSPGDTLYSVDPVRQLTVSIGRRSLIAYIIFPRYEPSCEPQIRSISGMEALRRLIATKNYISLGTAEKQSAVDLMLSVIANAKCFELLTGDLEKTVSLVDGLG